MMNSEKVTFQVDFYATEVISTPAVECEVIRVDFFKPLPQPKKGRALSSFLKDWESDAEKSAELVEARQWLGEQLRSECGMTLRDIRLERGMSQARLAELIGTKQPHIARIEKGCGTIEFDTMDKICEALKIDLNTLGAALKLKAQQSGAGIRK